MSRPVTAAVRVWLLAGLAAMLSSFFLLAGGESARAAVPSRVAIILVDTNNSPSYARRLADERNQALEYARALAPDIRVGVIFFGNIAHVVLPPTTSRSRLTAALMSIQPAGTTSRGIRSALADAVAEINRFGAAAHSRVLVLSDAESIYVPVPAIAVPVDAVLSKYDGDDYPGRLHHLIAATKGSLVSPSSVAALAAAFPPLPSAAASPPPQIAPSTVRPPSISLFIVLGLVFIVLFYLAMLLVRSLRPGKGRPNLLRSIERYGPQRVPGSAAASDVTDESPITRRAVGIMSRLLKARDAEPRLARRLDRAGISRSPAEWALLGVVGSVVLVATLTVMLGSLLVGGLTGVVAGYAGMRLFLSLKIARRSRAFDEQLPTVLQLVASSIASGFSLAQALDAVVRENSQPASGEFARALAETRIGIDLADALDEVADRLRSPDLRWVIMALRIQRETGGNLAEVLRNTVATMRERAYLRRQVRSLSAEGRLSAYVLLALPVVVSGWLFLTDPSYMRPLYLTFLGLTMLVGGLVMVTVGSLWMRKLIKVEV